MLRKTLITACLLVASGSAMAIDEFVSRHGIAPRVSITFGGGHHDYGYRDTRYHDVYMPRPVRVQPIYYTNYYREDSGRHHGWRNHDNQHSGWRGHDRYDDDDYDDDDRHHRSHGHHEDD